MNKKRFKLGKGIEIGDGAPLVFFAGPCVVESREHCFKIAKFLRGVADLKKINLVFKASHTKANRTSGSSFRGIGVEEGLRVLEEVRKEFGFLVVTDVHETVEVASVAQAVDVLQIPAFLCRQTALLEEVGKTNKPILIKKGQFLAPEDMSFAAEKVGSGLVIFCERGSLFGYRDLVVDMRGLVKMRESGYPVVFDGTHSVQSMGGATGKSGGDRDMVFPLLRAATACGVDGLFFECHDEPEKAPSDGPNMLRLEEVPHIVQTIIEIDALIRKSEQA